jgi:hypothetical protein
MSKTITTLLSAVAACVAMSAAPAFAQDAAAPTITKEEAKDLKVQSKGEYKARKKVADANKDLNKADCEVAADGKLEHACKKDARATAKQEKAEAKVIHEAEKADIKQKTEK